MQHAVLGLATLALAAAAMRAASLTGATGLERIVAAAAIAAAAAALECLALGLAGLGSSPVALPAAAGLTWLGARRLPACRSALAEFHVWWRTRGSLERALVGAAFGGFVALCAWLLRYPYVGNDGVTYHLSTVADFVRSGTPTELAQSSYLFPTANHPLTNELLLSWPVGIARSFSPATMWTPVMLLLASLASWVGLRSVGVEVRVRALAVAALCLLPLNVEHLNEPNSDTPALAWLLCAAALAAGANRRPALLVPAVVAGGLALGTKTTVLWPLAVVLGGGAYLARRHLRSLAWPLALAGATAAAVGGYWYARNTVDHGYPLWPFLEAPWSDPVPRLLKLFSHGFIDRPGMTLQGRVDEYVKTLAGGVLLIPAALLLPFAARRREASAAAAVAVVAVLLWTNAPITGLGDVIGLENFSISALRYLLPAMAVVVLTVALAARSGGAVGIAATGVLAIAVVWNLVAAARLGFPYLPGLKTLMVGGLVGAAAASLPRWRPPRPTFAAPAAALAAAFAGALLAAPAGGWVKRHAAVARTQDAELVRWFAAAGHLDDKDPLAFTRVRYAPLAGDRVDRPLDLVPEREPCATARRRGWLVIGAAVNLPVRGRPGERFPEIAPVERCRFPSRPAYESASVRVYAPRGSGSAAR